MHLDQKEAIRLQVLGMQQAIDHADKVVEGWSAKARTFLLNYIRVHKSFMAEDVRHASRGVVPIATDERAWGGIFQGIAKAGFIKVDRYDKAKDKKSHGNPKPVWRVVNS